MATPSELVTSVFSQAQSYVSTHTSTLTSFTDRLNDAIFTNAAIDSDWQSIEAPTAVVIPDRPAAMDTIEEELVWDTSITSDKPASLAVSAPSIDIDDFIEAAPDVTVPAAPTLDFGTAPTLNFATAPVAPTVTEITVDAAPTIEEVALPTMLTLTTPTLGTIDIHADFLTNLENVPTLTLLAPTPYQFEVSERYKSETRDSLIAAVAARYQNGGTGLNATVEDAIWTRGRDREAALGQAAIDEITRSTEALGFAIPPGAVSAQIRAREKEMYDKMSGVSRDVMIKQAEMEQANVLKAFDQATEMEVKLVEHAYQMENLAFQSASKVADNAVQIYNAQVDKFKAVVDGYRAYASAYDALIKGEMTRIDVYKAQLAGEQNKVETNKALVEQFKAQIEAGQIRVNLYTAQVNGAKARMDLQAARLSAFGEEVKAYVAGINGETARVETYKIGVQAQQVKAEAHKAIVDASLATVQVYDSKVRAFSAKVGAQGDKARAQLAYYQGVVSAKTSEWQAWAERIRGEAERFRALTAKSGAMLDAYKAETQTILAKSEQDVKRWEIGIKQYEAQANYSLAVSKANTDVIQATRAAQLDAAKVGATVYSQLTSAAMGLMHVNAGVQGSSSTNVGYSYGISYSYGGDTSANTPPVVFTPVTSV
jgi:hypothetical protein